MQASSYDCQYGVLAFAKETHCKFSQMMSDGSGALTILKQTPFSSSGCFSARVGSSSRSFEKLIRRVMPCLSSFFATDCLSNVTKAMPEHSNLFGPVHANGLVGWQVFSQNSGQSNLHAFVKPSRLIVKLVEGLLHNDSRTEV